MKRIAAVLSFLLCSFLALTVQAAQPLDVKSRIGALTWGATVEEALAAYREQMVDRFRQQSAGVSDPVKVEELRREVDASVKRAADSLERFEGPRTGYETSLISGEFTGGSGATLLTIRPTASLTGTFQYLVFVEGRLSKVLIALPYASIEYMMMESYEEKLVQEFGKPDDRQLVRDDIGVKLLRSSTWSDGKTRVRLVARSSNLQGHLLAVEDASRPIVSGMVDASVQPRRSVEDLLGGEGAAPKMQEEDDDSQ